MCRSGDLVRMGDMCTIEISPYESLKLHPPSRSGNLVLNLSFPSINLNNLDLCAGMVTWCAWSMCWPAGMSTPTTSRLPSTPSITRLNKNLISETINMLWYLVFVLSDWSNILSTLRRKSQLCIPFLGIARPQSRFPHPWVCERFIYSQDRSTYFPAAELGRLFWECINRSWAYGCGNWDLGRTIPLQRRSLIWTSIVLGVRLTGQFKLLNSQEWSAIYICGACSSIRRQTVDEITTSVVSTRLRRLTRISFLLSSQ